MPACLAFVMLTCLQVETRDGLPSWAYALTLDGEETTGSLEELPGILQGAPPDQGAGRGRDVSDFTLNVAAHARYAIPFGAADHPCKQAPSVSRDTARSRVDQTLPG